MAQTDQTLPLAKMDEAQGARGLRLDVNVGTDGASPAQIEGQAPAPWSGKEEAGPESEYGDHDVPFIIRDAAGKIVMTIWEAYGPGMVEYHTLIGERIVAAINKAEAANAS